VREPRFRLGAVIAVAVAAGLITWLVLSSRGSSKPAAAPDAIGMSGPALRSAATALGGFDWAGPRPHTVYELTKTSDGRTYVRYLPEGTKVGDPRPEFLTIGTYRQPHAFANVRAAARRPRAHRIPLANGGLAVYDANRPTSVYLAYPGAAYQVEVYSPSPAQARALVRSGQVRPVGQPAATQPAAASFGPRSVTQAQLRARSASFGSPIYWVGSRPATIYELTRTSAGRIYLRYLPHGARVGSPKASFLSIGTYRVPQAFARVKDVGSGKGAVQVALPEHGIAVYSKARPTNVYVAYPGSPYQIEVYDPRPQVALVLVRSGSVVPVG
jgi:hypothetical protein